MWSWWWASSSSSLWILLTAVLWGATDPLLKRYGGGGEEETASPKNKGKSERSFLGSVASGLWASFSNWKYSCAFAANQLGSATFLAALATNDVSVAAPAANGLKFLFNAAAGRMLGEEAPSKTTLLGIALIAAGSLLHMMD